LAGAFEDGLRMVRVLDEQPTQAGDHLAAAPDAVSRRQIGDELAQPRRWILQAGGEVVPGNERPVGVTLPAGVTQSEAGMAPQLTALAADPRWLLGRSGS
jgi:hypothetical protein